ncbi:hypothetical protein VTL71DRAFT_8683 [Oculimacula yallundae]|uniref:Uncharacterized protein n=1 Tax=Oculimacula yallundae TaxID=86028 RepID=A0ABR4CZV0_9HELO
MTEIEPAQLYFCYDCVTDSIRYACPVSIQKYPLSQLPALRIPPSASSRRLGTLNPEIENSAARIRYHLSSASKYKAPTLRQMAFRGYKWSPPAQHARTPTQLWESKVEN